MPKFRWPGQACGKRPEGNIQLTPNYQYYKLAGQGFKVSINPKVMQWAINTSGWNYGELAVRLKVEQHILEEWKIHGKIEFKKLEHLAELVKRPSAAFFLANPPEESEPTDYRRLADGQAAEPSRKTILAIRRARYIQCAAAEMLKSRGIDSKPQISKTSLKTPPEEAAKSERIKLGFDQGGKMSSKEARRSPNNFYRVLRETIESFGIFVLQASMPVEDVRGITLSGKFPLVILINSKDILHARIFSLLHEYGHVLLQKDGMCQPESSFQGTSRGLVDVEAWCNSFAASILMPKTEFLEEYDRLAKKHDDVRRIVNSLSSTFKVSITATIIRIQSLGRGAHHSSDLLGILHDDKNKPAKPDGDKHSYGGPEPSLKCISQNGMRFVSLVLESQMDKSITNSDVIDYLGMDLKHMKKLQERVT